MSETPAVSPRLERLRSIVFNADFIEAFAHLSDLDVMRICIWRLLELGSWVAAAHIARHRAAYFHPRLAPLPASTHARAPAAEPPGVPLPTSEHAPPAPPRGDDPPGRDEIVRRAAENGVRRLYEREMEVLGSDQTVAYAAARLRHDLGFTRITAMLRAVPRGTLAAMESCEPGRPHDKTWVNPAWLAEDDSAVTDAMRDLLALRYAGVVPPDSAFAAAFTPEQPNATGDT